MWERSGLRTAHHLCAKHDLFIYLFHISLIKQTLFLSNNLFKKYKIILLLAVKIKSFFKILEVHLLIYT